MKQALLSATIASILTVSSTLAFGQNPGGAAAAPAMPYKVGLIDMGQVFKNYKKFEVLRSDLKAEFEAQEAKAKEMAQHAQELQQKMKQLKEGSPQYSAAEKELATASAEFESFRRSVQRDLLKREGQMYHQIYTEVSDVVRLYAEHFKYTLVMRFSRDELDPENPQQVIQGIGARQVVYFRDEDDITEPVIDYLNRQYEKGPAGAAGAAATSGAASQPKTTTRPPAANSGRKQ